MTRRSLLLLAGILLASQPGEARDEIGDSVVKILVTRRGPDFVRPWTKAAPSEVSGSGVVIEGNRILTNAHVVQYASQIFIQANQSADKISASVIAVGPEIDLALIRPEDESFFAGRPALPLGEGIPRVKDTVNVYGYPTGGEQLSITEGIVSRIEFSQFYYMSQGLRIQIDAALNPGNSGGPAIADGKIAGLVFSNVPKAENIGYLISVDEVAAFLQDVEDGTYDGKPLIFDLLQSTENDALRAKLGLEKEVTGVMVTQPFSDDESYPLKAWDVVTRMGEYDLDNQGKVRVRDDLRLSFQYLVAKLAQDGTVRCTVVRGGKTMEVDVPVRTDPGLVVRFLKGDYPRYFIAGPVILMPASQELLAALRADSVAKLAFLGSPFVARLYDHSAFEDEELVMLGYSLFPHPIAKGYARLSYAIVSHVDDTPVKNLAHLVRTLRDASGPYVTFRMAGKYETIVFQRKELLESTEEILADEGIRNQCSEDLRELWSGSE